MRKILTFIAGTLITGSLLAGGLVTNTNQSAMFTRMQNRNTSTSIDAAYFNPAGLAKMEDGFYASINNQFIRQKRTITTNYSALNNLEYIGNAKANLFPGVYAAYKTGKLAVSAGFNVIGGGGGAEYKTGLPSFEMDIADIKAMLTYQKNIPTSQYSADIYFKGRSVNFGVQANVSYEINDMIAVAVGARYVSANNSYKGHIDSIRINPILAGVNPSGAMMLASTFFGLVGEAEYALKTANRSVDVKESGSGFSPIMSLHVTPIEELNISLRYEFKTKLELTTEIIDNKSGGIFTEGEKVIADMPALLAVGVDYKLMDNLLLAYTFNMYFDKNVDYDGSTTDNVVMIDKNLLEYGVGAEYGISDKFRISAGWVATSTGVKPSYQNDQRYSTNTNSIGAGFGYQITPMIDFNLGGQYTFYKEGSKTIDRTIADPTEKYNKSTWLIGAGLDFSFGK